MTGSPDGTGFTPRVHAYLHDRATRSARRIVPLLLRWVAPRSVLDVGCGLGAWLAAFRERGVADVVGMDAPDLARKRLAFPPDRFLPRDLSRPFDLGRGFDLAVCLEVGEHLPAEAADPLVSSLIRHAPVVLFSAAVPHQGGTGHLNERWPAWWARRFRRSGHLAVDCLRDRVWDDPDVQWWYAQNAVLYIREGSAGLARILGAAASIRSVGSPPRPRVHPRNLGTRWWRTDWPGERRRLERALEEATPPDAAVLVPDAARLDLRIEGRRVWPFPERESERGPPADAGAAIAELRRLCARGATHVAFPWPTFWWLDQYTRLGRHLRERHALEWKDERLLLFRLTE